MDRVKIDTAQNVLIDYEAAGIGDRTVATIIDLFVLIAYLSTAFLFVGNNGSLAISVLISIPYLLYFLISETLMNGQTLGKKARGIVVTRIDGTQPRFGDYIIRWLFRMVEIDLSMGLIALITVFLRGNGQRLGDMAAGTAVVKKTKPTSLKETLYADLQEDYILTFQETSVLSEKEVTLAKEVLDTLIREKTSPGLTAAAEKMKHSLLRKMNTTSDLPPKSFLHAVIQDYNFLRR